ncbi:MAG: hypothetical protein HZA90_01190 [Verrucomicrobia bacterium]|nr:hypothetical protein [Verrucomicrobiota bacterium]
MQHPLVLWLEDDDKLREEMMKQAMRELRNVRLQFFSASAGFWRGLRTLVPKAVVIDVMLPQVDGVRRLSEGVMLAKWIRDGCIPDRYVKSLGLENQEASLTADFSKLSIIFLTGRSEYLLRRELGKLTMDHYLIIEKAANEESSGVDEVFEYLRQRRKEWV